MNHPTQPAPEAVPPQRYAAPSSAPLPAAPARPPGPPKAFRASEDALLGGVAAGLAEHLGWPVGWVRAGFLVSTFVTGIGAPLYVVFWLVLPTRERFVAEAPGLAAASRSGRRESAPAPRTRRDSGPLVAAATVVLGLTLLVAQVTGTGAYIWPLALLGLSVAVLWRQADEAQRVRWRDSSGRVGPWRALIGDGGWGSWTRIISGLVLLMAAVMFLVLRASSYSFTGAVVLTSVLAVGGATLLLGPWLFRLSSDLTAERAERIRVEERADLAAHLHDSVLQTLALIQRNAADPAAVSQLARAQERDLRNWLFGNPGAPAQSLTAALQAAAAAVEDAHGVPVEVVCVGDAPVTDALVAAAREAMSNAARHSGAPRVDVYAEAGAGGVDVYIRDRGRGFDVEAVPADRRGISGSIVERMRRHHGWAEVRSGAGGTEVRLHLGPSPENGAGTKDANQDTGEDS